MPTFALIIPSEKKILCHDFPDYKEACRAAGLEP